MHIYKLSNNIFFGCIIYKIKIKQKACGKFCFVVATQFTIKVQLKD